MTPMSPPRLLAHLPTCLLTLYWARIMEPTQCTTRTGHPARSVHLLPESVYSLTAKHAHFMCAGSASGIDHDYGVQLSLSSCELKMLSPRQPCPTCHAQIAHTGRCQMHMITRPSCKPEGGWDMRRHSKVIQPWQHRCKWSHFGQGIVLTINHLRELLLNTMAHTIGWCQWHEEPSLCIPDGLRLDLHVHEPSTEQWLFWDSLQERSWTWRRSCPLWVSWYMCRIQIYIIR